LIGVETENSAPLFFSELLAVPLFSQLSKYGFPDARETCRVGHGGEKDEEGNGNG